MSKGPNIYLLYSSQRLFSRTIVADSETPVVPDGHINILHIHLEQIIALTKEASICLAASPPPGDSLGAQDKHICAANPQRTITLKQEKVCPLYYSATVSLARSIVSNNSSSVFDSF